MKGKITPLFLLEWGFLFMSDRERNIMFNRFKHYDLNFLLNGELLKNKIFKCENTNFIVLVETAVDYSWYTIWGIDKNNTRRVFNSNCKGLACQLPPYLTPYL